MTLSNITDRGTLRGVIYRGAGSGTTDYTELSNKPQINGHTLQGNQSGDDLDLIDKGSLEINEHTLEGSMTGDDLGLINSSDLSFNVGYAGNILHNIKYKNNTYNAYANPFNGASSDGNGTMGLVPAPLSSQSDYNKFLKGNGRWANIMSYDNLYHNTDGSYGVKNIILPHNLNNYAFIFFTYIVTTEGTLSQAVTSLFPIISNSLTGSHKYFIVCYPTYGNRYITLYSEDGINVTLDSNDYGGNNRLSVVDIYGVKIGSNTFQ